MCGDFSYLQVWCSVVVLHTHIVQVEISIAHELHGVANGSPELSSWTRACVCLLTYTQPQKTCQLHT